jgi:hypothetical protein
VSRVNDYPGDELVPDANAVFDRRAIVRAAPEEIWPWLVQLGKHRAGWYLPRGAERFVPPGRRASRAILPEHQALAVGDRIPDYGGRHDWLEATRIEPPLMLVYRTERRGTPFSWALLMTPLDPASTVLHLRFRARLRGRGARRRAVVVLGGAVDAATGELMIRGLRERVE